MLNREVENIVGRREIERWGYGIDFTNLPCKLTLLKPKYSNNCTQMVGIVTTRL